MSFGTYVDRHEGRALCFIIMLIIAMVAGGVVAARMVGHHNEQVSCRRFGVAAGREVVWADYTFWDYECLVRQTDGRFVTRRNLR